MILKFSTTLILLIILNLLMIYLGSLLSKKMNKPGVGGGLLGFFLGIGILFFVFFTASRVYVITGDEEYIHYMVLGSPEYTMPNGEVGNLSMEYDQCFVINEWTEPVIIEEVKYGGYGFSGSTQWVKAGDYEIIDNHKIFYFYENEPPKEISVRGSDDEEVVRKWLRNRRK